MSQGTNSTVSPFLRNLFDASLYKRSQGRVARQVTFAAAATIFALGAYALSNTLLDQDAPTRFGVAGAVLLLGLWVSYRAVNLPQFADFLIAVEAEINKVTWPTRNVLFRSSIVVIFLILFLAGLLFAYDLFWSAVLTYIGIIG